MWNQFEWSDIAPLRIAATILIADTSPESWLDIVTASRGTVCAVRQQGCELRFGVSCGGGGVGEGTVGVCTCVIRSCC